MGGGSDEVEFPTSFQAALEMVFNLSERKRIILTNCLKSRSQQKL